MADTKKKSTYNFGGHEFDAALYLLNLKDNAQGYLDSHSDWNDAQKEEWKHSYENFTNALAQDIKDGTGRFSTDEFGNITDNKGEFSNTDSDNYYYDDKGKQISGDDYNNLKDRKKKKYSGFESNRWLATYANLIGTALRDKLKEKGTDSTSDSEDFDYTKNGFAAFWNKKHNPAGGEVDVQPYWDLDKDGGYTNRINSTLTDLEEYLQRDDLPDTVRKNAEAYRDKLQEYLNKGEGFNEDTWKSLLRIAAQNAGVSTWNNGFFKFDTSGTAADNSKKDFDINNDLDVIDRYLLADLIAAHPEQRANIIDLARRQYNLESQLITDLYNTAIKLELDAKNNKIWETYLANNSYLKDVTKRIGRSGTGSYWSGGISSKKDENHVSQTMISAEDQAKADEDPNYKPQLRKEVRDALSKANWANAEDPLLQSLSGVTTTTGQKLNNLGKWYQFNWNLLMARRNMGAMNGWTAYKDKTGKNEVWRRDDSYRAKDGTYLYMFNKNGRIYTYRSKPYDKLKADVIAKGLLGMSMRTREAQQAAEARLAYKAQISAQTAKDKDRTAQLQKNMEKEGFTGTDIARLASIGMDLGSMGAALTGPETLGAGTLVSAGLGVGSTATNFVADLVDGENLGNAAKTAITGLGMDALGLIPGTGAASKFGKIGETLIRYVPRLLAAYGAYLGYENMPYIVNSTKKLVTPGAKMTVDDYRNIAQGIGLVTGVVSAGGRRVRGQKNASDFKTAKEQKEYLQGGSNKKLDGPGTRRINMDNEVALRFKDKKGKLVTKTFSGEDAEKIRNASSNDEINEVLANYDLKGLTLDTRTSLRPHFLWIRNKSKKWQSPIHRSLVTATRYDVYKTGTGRYVNATGLRGWLDPIYDKKAKITAARKNKLTTDGTTPSDGTTSTSGTTPPTSNTSQLSMAELNELSSKLKPLKDEWTKLKGAASTARKSRAKDLLAARAETNKDIRDAYLASAEQNRQSMEALATEYTKLRNLVNNNKLTFEVGPSKKQILMDWNDILKQYGMKYKQGGSIRKFGEGGQSDWYSALQAKGDYDANNYAHTYDTSTLYAGDMSNGPQDYYVSNLKGTINLRYAPTNGTFGDSVQAIEDLDYYKRFGKDLLNETGTDFSEMGKAWAKAVDALLPAGSDASFYDALGNLRKQWWAKNQDSMGRTTKLAYTKLADYVAKVRNDQILGARHNVYLNKGKRYFYKDSKGVLHWVNPEDIGNYVVSEKPVSSGWSNDKTTYWDDYELTGKKSAVNPMNLKPAAQQGNINLGLQEPDLIAKWGIPRAMAADATNRAVTDKLKKQPLLLDPQEDHRYIQSDLDAEMNGIEAAAQWYRYAANPITANGDTQTALGLEAVGKANDAITQGRQTSNERLRTMAEQAWQQEVTNHTSRHNTAMTNRLSIYDTKNANNSLEAAYDNLKFTIWDTLAQEKEYKEKSDYEQLRAKYDQFAQLDINNSIKYGMLGLNYKAYGMTDADAKLWDSVYNTGTETLENILKDPEKLKQWTRILSITRLMLNDMLAQHYHIPQSPYHTVRTASYSPTISTSATKLKQGGCLNVKKVRAAAKGEKLAAALLKAQTADADRFYKTTKDTIDRMYDAIDRLTNYSSTKKKRKKKS